MIFLAVFGVVSCAIVIPLFFYLLGVKAERKKWDKAIDKSLIKTPDISVNDVIAQLRQAYGKR